MTATPYETAWGALGEPWAVAVETTPLPDLKLAHVSETLAATLSLPGLAADSPALRAVMAGAQPLPGAQPVATVYAGHQFGQFVPQLGDGRAHLIGVYTDTAGARHELQLKGSGPTPFSRFADGRAVLRSSLREYVASEALHALGVPTTRALALGVSSEPVRRERMERAATVLRVAPSFLRFGHFEYWAYRGQLEPLRQLADWAIANWFPQFEGRYADWLGDIIDRTADLIVHWQTLGFCHGVMNTDNMSLLGLTLDYGPYGFLDAYDPGHICNHSDEAGRYAYDQQPHVAHWNCARLLEACLSLLDPDQDRALTTARALLERFPTRFRATAGRAWRAKFGLGEHRDDDDTLMNGFLDLLARGRHDFSACFRALPDPDRLHDLILDQAALDRWYRQYRDRCDDERADTVAREVLQRSANPARVPRNHLLQLAITAAEQDDFAPLSRLMDALSAPYQDADEFADLADLPPAWAAALSVSCSS